jgi:phosphoribosyl 1,2-cyclic phosphate phosphodiesterase
VTITFLGTGTSQGVPVIACECGVCTSVDFRDKRTRTSVHIETKGLSLIIDIGPDFRIQVLREKIFTLDAILLTHEHKDHTAGLDEVRSFNFKQGRDMPLYGRARVLEQLKTEFGYIFSAKQYPGVPKVELIPIKNKPFDIGKVEVTPIEVLHYKLPVYGFRIEDFVYITDANYISEEEKSKIVKADVLVLNALQQKPHISHFTLKEALDLIDELKPKRAFLTHISHSLGLTAEVSKILPDNVSLAHDGLKVVS